MTITMIKTTAIDIDIAIISIHYNDELDDNAKMITACNIWLRKELMIV